MKTTAMPLRSTIPQKKKIAILYGADAVFIGGREFSLRSKASNFTLEEIVYNSISSGCDILLLCGGRNIEMQKEFAEIGVRLVEEGKIPMEVVDRAVERILKAKEMLGMRLCVLHNLYFYNELMAKIREAIEEKRFAQFRAEYSEKLSKRI